MPAHYLIFHPKRQKINARVKVLRDNLIYEEDKDILVDKLACGCSNEDPFVFTMPWLYSYCHATDIKRKPNNIEYIQPGSHLIFVDYYLVDYLIVDTVFYVDNVLVWPEVGTIPPSKYSMQMGDTWFRHIRYGVGQNSEHIGQITYEAQMYWQNKMNFSFLPLSKKTALKIKLNELDKDLSNRIRKRLNSKTFKKPEMLNDYENLKKNDLNSILNLIRKMLFRESD